MAAWRGCNLQVVVVGGCVGCGRARVKGMVGMVGLGWSTVGVKGGLGWCRCRRQRGEIF